MVVGAVFLVHGLQKLLQIGIGGFAGLLEGLPAPFFLAALVTFAEIICGVLLILGLFARLAAIPLAIDMVVATLLVHVSNGFFIQNNGFEFTLVLFAANVVLMVSGPGETALDRLLATRTSNPAIARLTR